MDAKDIVERLEYRVELSAAAGGWNVIDPKERVSIAFFIVESDAVHACKAINAVVTALCAERDAAVESRDEARDFIAQIVVCIHNHGAWTSADVLHELCERTMAICRQAGVALPIASTALNHPALNPKPEENAR